MNDLDTMIELLEEQCPCEACERLRKARKPRTLGARVLIYVEKLRKAMR